MSIGDRILRLLTWWVLVATVFCVWGQASKSTSGFEVASIRLHDPAQTTDTMKFSPSGEVWISGLSIKNLVFLVYNLRENQIAGGPKWLDTEIYDIRAKSQPPSRGHLMDEQKARLAALLADRFQLRVHREQRTTSVYYLNIARGGLKLQPASKGTVNTKGSIIPWNIFVSDLSQRLDRPIIDNARLDGAYYIALRYTTDDGAPSGIGIGKIDKTDPEARSWPSIFAALQRQMGLQLDSGKGPVDLLVIDSVSHPSPN